MEGKQMYINETINMNVGVEHVVQCAHGQ
ncbi:hypothetical protein Tco_1007147, partial [Tanacetum coccineum]